MAGKDSKPPQSPAARKGKPRDLAEEHKPSRKVALNEVLRSLQDLVNNELAVAPAKTPSTVENTASEAVEKVTPPAPAPVMETATAAPEPVAPPEPEPPVVAVPPEGLQQELPLAGPSPAALAIQEPDAAVEPASPPVMEPVAPAESPAPGLLVETEAEPSDLPPLEPVAEENPAPLPAARMAAEEGDLGEIPVLEDIIDFHDETEPRAGNTVPPASEARRLAIQVAARLNVELRKAGKPNLTSDVITRLARILEEALAKAGTNMENSPPEKH